MDTKFKKYKLENGKEQQRWPWWPLLPLYPYGERKTIFKELVPNQHWSFEQLQGVYYVAVPVRLTVVRVSEGLMLFNPLPPTPELLKDLSELEKKYGKVRNIVLPTASGLEHKISLPALARAFPKANLWICPGQWSFPVQLPLDWLGIPKSRTRILFADGLPNKDSCEWFSLGPLDIGLGRFQEVSCFHKTSKSLLVTDALVGIEDKPPELFNFDPTALLFHSRDKGDEPLLDSYEARKKGWRRLVLFASFLRPQNLEIPNFSYIINNAFKPDLRNFRAHFGIYPFAWKEDWETSSRELIGINKPLVQIAPVLERLVFPRSRETFINWLDKVTSMKGMKWLISSHYSSPIRFTTSDASCLRKKILNRNWAKSSGNWIFLDWLDKTLLKLKIVPSDPLRAFKD